MHPERPFTIESEYTAYLEMIGFFVDSQFHTKPGVLFSLDPSIGEGTVWVYAKTGHFFIQAMDFCFYEAVPFEYPQFDFISFGYYETPLYADKQAVFNSPYLLGYRSHAKVFKSIIPKQEAVRNICIVLSPTYYEHYLSKIFPDEYKEIVTALEHHNGLLHIPELILLLKQIMNFTGSNAAGRIYYESKVAEMLALIVNHSHHPGTQKTLLTEQDQVGVTAVVNYIDNQYGDFRIQIEQLAKLACMSPSKLKYSFKDAYNCTISEYMCKKRIQEAKHALEHSQISIGELARKLGYKKTRSFSDFFRKHIGLLPNQYRKLAQGKIHSGEIKLI
ncbi:helix-turn-helix transcriptional regulator [Bacillus sp. 1P02SD]|uniref:helix-turn-helix transcriptional regulator n=1 Tax=Bacillus sp. 1P02SD TaxID=3132264 RepID=UPI00399EFBD7